MTENKIEVKTKYVNTDGEMIQTLPTAGEIIVQDTDKFTIVKLPNGKFRKDMKYKKLYTHVPTDQAEMLELYKVLNTEDNEDVVKMSTRVGSEIQIQHIYTNPYQSFDEETGGNVNGVTTTIFTGTEYIATSSKSVYYTLLNLFDTFGSPSDEGYKPITVKITSRKMQNGDQINLQLISI